MKALAKVFQILSMTVLAGNFSREPALANAHGLDVATREFKDLDSTNFISAETAQTKEYTAIVIGSGCGGALIAANLSSAGHNGIGITLFLTPI